MFVNQPDDAQLVALWRAAFSGLTLQFRRNASCVVRLDEKRGLTCLCCGRIDDIGAAMAIAGCDECRIVCHRGECQGRHCQPVLVSVTSSPTAPRSADQGSCVPCRVRCVPNAALDTAKQHDELASLHGSGGAT